MCLKDASVLSIAAISEKSKFRYISADINDSCIHSFISVIYLLCWHKASRPMPSEYKVINIQDIITE